jgi:hypothetical protein
MEKLDFENTFIIRCSSFEDRKDLYLNYLFHKHPVYVSDWKDYNSIDDYEEYPFIRWEKDYNHGNRHFVASSSHSEHHKSISSDEFRILSGVSDGLKKFRSGGCDSSLRFTFSFNKLEGK